MVYRSTDPHPQGEVREGVSYSLLRIDRIGGGKQAGTRGTARTAAALTGRRESWEASGQLGGVESSRNHRGAEAMDEVQSPHAGP